MARWKEVGNLNLLLEPEDWSRSQEVLEDSKQKQAKLNRRNTCCARICAAQGLVCEVHLASMLKSCCLLVLVLTYGDGFSESRLFNMM
jgi:hypothetical protein